MGVIRKPTKGHRSRSPAGTANSLQHQRAYLHARHGVVDQLAIVVVVGQAAERRVLVLRALVGVDAVTTTKTNRRPRHAGHQQACQEAGSNRRRPHPDFLHTALHSIVGSASEAPCWFTDAQKASVALFKSKKGEMPRLACPRWGVKRE